MPSWSAVSAQIMTDESGNTPRSNTMHTLAGPSNFPTTRWTLVIAAADPQRKEARAALVSLCIGSASVIAISSGRRLSRPCRIRQKSNPNFEISPQRWRVGSSRTRPPASRNFSRFAGPQTRRVHGDRSYPSSPGPRQSNSQARTGGMPNVPSTASTNVRSSRTMNRFASAIAKFSRPARSPRRRVRYASYADRLALR